LDALEVSENISKIHFKVNYPFKQQIDQDCFNIKRLKLKLENDKNESDATISSPSCFFRYLKLDSIRLHLLIGNEHCEHSAKHLYLCSTEESQ